MNRQVNSISGRLSLRPPQRRSLEILDRVTELVRPGKDTDLAAALAAIGREFPSVTDFEREFVSLCFALATGVGKTRLMGAFISYLLLAHGINNFFVLAPNLTIYNKLITDFTPNTPKYVFTGIAEFAVDPPTIITGESYAGGAGVREEWRRQYTIPGMHAGVHINIFNISKINSEVRGGKAPRIKRLSEYIGESYFDYLAGLPDLVLIMDESHRYRASAGVRAINELKPVLGLELTATPQVETSRGPVDFKNVIYDYPLGQAMADGFVKEPAVVTRKDFDPAGMSAEEIERLKLEDGVRLHESVKVELETYARENGKPIKKPFLLVIARDTTHAGQLLALIQDGLFEGRYRDKVIQVDSSRTGAEEEEMIERLLKVEQAEEPTEIVIHVNMLKEGWDVNNLYTIVPLRAANASILIKQSIGRGLRLPYGKRTGVMALDRLNIVAHDKFQEIIDEANRPDSAIRMQSVFLDDQGLGHSMVTVVSPPKIETLLGLKARQGAVAAEADDQGQAPIFKEPEELKIAQLAREVIGQLENKPRIVPGVEYLLRPEVLGNIVKDVEAYYRPGQLELEGASTRPDVSAVVQKTVEIVQENSITIPRILEVPQGEVRTGFHAFTLDLDKLRYPVPSDELWVQHLRTNQQEILALGKTDDDDVRLEDYIVSGLMGFNDIDYDRHADLLYDLASQAVRHFRNQFGEEDTRNVLRCHQREIAKVIHEQLQAHAWEETAGYEVRISKGFSTLKERAYTQKKGEPVLDFHQSPADKSNMARYLFTGFSRCLYNEEKFQSEPERILAVILDRDALKWFRPAKGQFQIPYRNGMEHNEYQPDFVAETGMMIYLIESKEKNKMGDPIVLAKKEAAVAWCANASTHAQTYQGKPWRYVLIPHDVIAINSTITALVERYGV